MGAVKARIEKLEKLYNVSGELDTLDKFILAVCRRNIDEESGLELILDCHVELMRRHDPEYYAKYNDLKAKLGFVSIIDNPDTNGR